VKRFKHSLSHTNLLSCDMGELIPCGIFEVLPGDTVQQATSALVRASPLLAPVMHQVDCRIHHWFVPHRLVWDDWENFITGGPDGLNASVFPTITIGGGSGAAVGSLADYLGVPTGVNNIVCSALPFRAYSLIWNENYRDQDLQTKLAISTVAGADTTTNTGLQNCAWEKDYFTSARPWEQKGPAVSIPITGGAQTLPVSGLGWKSSMSFEAAGSTIRLATGTGATETTVATAGQRWNNSGSAQENTSMKEDPNNVGFPKVFASLSGVNLGSMTVSSLRQAMALQRYEEARARYGSRYTEYLRFLGVKSSDARLQRPEYLGGGRQAIQFSELIQSAQDGTNPVGTLRGHGMGAMRSNRYRRFFEEHGYVISLLSVRPRTIYMQGMKRSFNRRVKEDFWQRELEHIGQQAVLNKEIYAAHASPDATFGYQDRYDEYRREESRVSGEFKTSLLNFWHLAREFSSSPALNGTFVSCVPTERVFAVNTTDVLWIMARHSIQARRMVSKVGTSHIF